MVLHGYLAEHANSLLDREKHRRTREIARYYTQDIADIAHYRELLRPKTKEVTGWDRLAKLQRGLLLFDRSKSWREAHQEDMHQRMCNALLACMFKEKLEAELPTIFSRLRIKRLRKELAIRLPRRWGKSYAAAQLVAAYALSNPGRKVAVFAAASRQTIDFLAYVKTHLHTLIALGNYGAVKIEELKETIVVWHGPRPEDVCEIRAYPCDNKVRPI